MSHKYFLIYWILSASFCSAYDKEDLRSLKQQVVAGQRIKAVGFNLQNADLRGIDFKDADFSNANLRGVNFSKANLTGAIFNKADISKAAFVNAKLINADLTSANLNGAKLRGVKLLGVKYEAIHSAKGTLFEDKQQLQDKLALEEKITTIEKAFIEGTAAHMVISNPLQMDNIYQSLIWDFSNKTKSPKEYILFHSNSQHSHKINYQKSQGSILSSHNNSINECRKFLKSSKCRPFIQQIVKSREGQALIVFLKNNNVLRNEERRNLKTLDLHGKTPLEAKYKLINRAIKQSYLKNIHALEIITGRGIHNPEGKMGVLWNLCRQYLTKKKFEPYIQKKISISKQGGWKVILKNKQRIKSSKVKNRLEKLDKPEHIFNLNDLEKVTLIPTKELQKTITRKDPKY